MNLFSLRHPATRWGVWAGTALLVFATMPCTDAAPAETLRTIDSANSEPPMYDWHPHNKMGIERGAFAGVKAFNRVLIREESGDILEVPFFHFTMRDLAEIMNRMARFPAETKVMSYESPSKAPIVHVHAADLPLGPLESWPNQGVIGGSFRSMNVDPVVEDVQGRRAVHFDCNRWYFDTEYQAMVLDTIPAGALADGKPFTLSAWVLHPKEPDVDDPEMLMSWHTRGGNDGTGLDWKRTGGWGDFYVAGLGGDLQAEPKPAPVPMNTWTHVAYVYTGGFDGELRIYENAMLANTARSKYLPELRDPVDITSDSVVVKGALRTASKDEAPPIRGYIGEYDAHHFPQLRHIGRWEQMNDIGPTTRGEFSIPFKDLKPGTRYFYRVYAGYNTDAWIPNIDPTRCWAVGAGSFVTATADGKPGRILPRETDRHVFLGVQWGSRWYGSYPGPGGWFRGYMSDVKLYDRALDEDEIRRDAAATATFGAEPADGSSVDTGRADFAWRKGIASAKRFRFYLDTDRAKVANATASARDVDVENVSAVELPPGRDVYWRVDTLDGDGNVLAQGPVWLFHVTYGEASGPVPESGVTTSATGYFRWLQSISSIKEQRVHFGTDSNAVVSGTAQIMRLPGDRRDCFAPQGQIYPGADWFWRVETEFNDGVTVPGPLWTFTTRDYFSPEFDGPVSEPYPSGIVPSRASKCMEGMGHPTISTPHADEETLRHIAHATKRFLRKSPALRNHLASRPCATTMATEEGPPCVDGFHCGSYGGMPEWNMTMHEMGHQMLMNGLGPMSPDFYDRLQEVFNSHADNNAWLGDYAACNIHENMAVNGHGFISGRQREILIEEDAPTYYLLDEFMPGDLAVELHPAYGLTVDADNRVLTWKNRGGVEDVVSHGQHYAPMPETVGSFAAVGSPVLKTVRRVSAVVFNGNDALAWDRELTYGFKGNRAWSVEVWALAGGNADHDAVILGWGPQGKGVRIYLNKGCVAWDVNGHRAESEDIGIAAAWHHLAFVFQGGGLENGPGGLTLFVNGSKALSREYKLDLVPGVLQVGGLVGNGSVAQGFKGALAHIRVHSYALSTDQVTEHYRCERRGYEWASLPTVGGDLYLDFDARHLAETGTEEHRPLYPAGLCKPWVRSWANRGILRGRLHNDVSDQWHYSGSTPIYGELEGIRAVQFNGKDRMVGVVDPGRAFVERGAGTLEMVVFNGGNSADNVLFQWGTFVLDSRMLASGWQHLAVTREGDRSVVFVDGQRVGELPYILKPTPLDHPHLGARFDPRRESWHDCFKGAVSQLRLHEKALSAEQVLAKARHSDVFTAHTPQPADGATVVAARKAALTWMPGRSAPREETVMFGEDPSRLDDAGRFASGTFVPNISGGKRYFWRVGSGPVWSFETKRGELISLSADTLNQGALESWNNEGAVGGRFHPADRGNLLGMIVDSFDGAKGLGMVKGRTMVFRPGREDAKALMRGPFTITMRVASKNTTDAVPVLSWGPKESAASVWLGTFSNDRRLLTIGKLRHVHEAYPPGELKLAYPEKCNARMSSVWKTITLTYSDGKAEMWYNTHCADSRIVDLAVGQLGEVVLGWDADHLNGSMLLGELRVYDRVLGELEIVQLAKEGKAEGTAPLIRVSADQCEEGSRVSSLKNSGSLGGAFTVAPESDRKPDVREVNGRQAVAFDGTAMLTSDFVLPDAISDTGPFTVEMWALQDEPSNGARLLAFSREVTERYTCFAMGSPANSRAVWRPFSDAHWRIDAREKPGQWIHLAYVYDGGMHSEIRLYRDGMLNAAYEYRTIDTIGGYPVSIGGIMSEAIGEKGLFKGAISSVSVYDYPRTAEEIAAAAGKPGK